MAWRPVALAITVLSISGALALSACGKAEKAAEPAKPFQPSSVAPPRKAGLWEQRISNGEAVQVSRLCVDAATEARLSWWGAPASKDICEKNIASARTDGGWQLSSVCDMGSGGKVTTSGVATGDFSAHYLIVAETSTVGAAAPQMNGLRKMTIDAAWQGPCPADMKGGDMALPGGLKINQLDVAAGHP
jgi:hypothetical protein